MKSAKFTLPVAALLLFGACIAGLPPSLRQDIADEHLRLQDAQHDLEHSRQLVSQQIAADPDLFRTAPEPAQWTAKFQAAQETLRTAEEADRELARLAGRNRASSRSEAEALLTKERNLRRTASDQAQAVIATASRWLDFRKNLPVNLDRMKQDYEAVRAVDLAPVSKIVEQAEQDWPSKRDALATRLDALREIPEQTEKEWTDSAGARELAVNGKITDAQLAPLIEFSDTLSADPSLIQTKAADLRALSGQLYDSWDQILVDLDKPSHQSDEQYRERIKTVRTHLTDVSARQSETSSSEHWVPISESTFHAVENDLGMSVAHKDAGLFDSEAITTPEPAGFAYIAPESQGSNQYGYWAHDGGQSVWTWLPQYLILRELLWNHSYRPVVLDEYRGYRTAQSVGRTYYGQTTPASPPKYGTHGSFTQSSYASSRYVQSGGYKGSAYASRGSFASAPHPAPQRNPSLADRRAGRQFGFGAGSPSGHRFGQGSGSRGFGRGFGRHR